MVEEKVHTKEVKGQEVLHCLHDPKKIALVAVGVIALVGILGLAAIGAKQVFYRGASKLSPGFRMERFGRDGLERGGMMGGRRGGFRGYMEDRTQGKVTAVDGKKFTIDVSGTVTQVQITDTTRFPMNSATTVKVGDTVVVMGEKDSGGVVQAIRIMVNPTLN